MSLSFLSPNRTVLLVSDEFLSVYTVSGSGVKLIDTIPWEAENFEKNVASIIAKDCGKKPVLILNDMVEQHYRKERVVRVGVGMVDKSSMVKRKLNVAFPHYPIRAAFPLKEKVAKTDSQPAADIYIFAAVAGNDQITKTIESTKKSMASVAAFCLLPIESSDMVKALSGKIGAKKGRKKNVWSIFIGQHQNGSLRQVLTKNGELALTRMSPIAEKDDDPQMWASELYQEFKSTISYLSRFGYDPADGLDVFVIANPAPAEALRSIFDEDYDLHILGVDEAARALGVNIGRQADMRYADVLHVAWAGRKGRFILPMKATQVDEVSKPRQVAMLVGMVLLCGSAFLGYQVVSSVGSLASLVSEIEDSKRSKSQLDAQYQREVQRLDEVGFDARLVQGALAVHKEFEDERIPILTVFQKVGKALGKDLRIDSIEIKKTKSTIAQNVWGAVKNEPQPQFEARMKMTYPSTANVDKGNKEVADLSGRIESLLPGYKVEVTKFLKDYEYTEGLIVEAGDLEKQNIQQDFVAEILIRGPAKE
ncbi:MAG: hypothetical protein KDI11_00550 [Alphaproteobacteria bacterium]|nr:hypothetical protein [Alphaproteobacteria bacterium]